MAVVRLLPRPVLNLALALACTFSPLLASAQVDRGEITGTVTDSAGAVIPEVNVVATEDATKAQVPAVSNGLGLYSLVNLPIGTYSISFSKAGFKSSQHAGVVVLANHTVKIDVNLQVGSVKDSVTVTGTPVLDVQPEVGTNLNDKVVNALPLSIAGGGRDQLSFAFSITPNVGGDSWYSSVNGSQQYTKNVMIDGTSIDAGVMGDLLEAGPSMDAIDQFQVNTNGLRAEESRTGGGAFMVELKSGTNKWHGSAFGFMTNEVLDANTWDNNWWLSQCAASDSACGDQYKRARNRYFDYGFSGGGPIWKDHTFFYAAYEKYQQEDWRANPTGATVPTPQMLKGDFSQLLGAPLINSATGQPFTDPSGNVIHYGSIFLPNGNVAPGNVIPSQYMSPISQQIAAIYQQNYKPTAAGITNNFPSILSNDPSFQQYQFSIKFDHYFSQKDHFAASYIYNHRPKTEFENPTTMWIPGTTDGGPLTSNSHQELHSQAYRFSETHTFTPSLLNVVSYTFNAFKNQQISLAPSADYASQIGLSSAYPDLTGDFPAINFNGAPNGVQEAQIGSGYTGGYVAYNGILNEAISWTKGRHNFKFGGEIRAIGYNNNGGNPGGYTLTFDNSTFAPANEQIQPFVGSAFANMLMGYVQSGSQGVPLNQYSRRKEYSLFAQDDWKITSKLTASLDLRWDITGPMHELHGYWSNFDLNAFNPSFNGLPGAFTWLSSPHDTFEQQGDYHQFGPHIGLAYAATSKMVVRASYGVIYVPLANNQFSAVPYGSSAALGFTGMNVVNPVPNANGMGQPAFQWDARYPGVTTPPSGPQPTSTYMPWGVVSIDPHIRQLGFTQNAYAGVEYQLTHDMKVNFFYSGAFGRNLHDDYGAPFNYPTWQAYQPLLMSGHVQDTVDSPESAAAAGVPYPYAGWSQAANAAIKPYPQTAEGYGGILFVGSPIGRSGYNSFTAEVTKRGANGLSMDLSYNYYRQTGNVCNGFTETWSFGPCGLQNAYDYYDSKGWSDPLTGQGVKGFVSYDLPFGHGRHFMGAAHGWMQALVGGWGISSIVSYWQGSQYNYTAGAVNSTNYYPGWPAVWANVVPNADFSNIFKTFNPGWNPTVPGAPADPNSLAFNPANFTNPAFGQLGNAPKVFSDWRGFPYYNEDISIVKRFQFGERVSGSLRADFFDAFNRHHWNSPNLDMSSPYFGHVTGVNGNRTGQIGARIQF